MSPAHVQVNYCFVTYDSFRSAQRACNQSERNIFGKVGTPCRRALHRPQAVLSKDDDQIGKSAQCGAEESWVTARDQHLAEEMPRGLG